VWSGDKGDTALKKVRIGAGAGFGGDRLEPALELIEKGNLDYIIFECLAERTIALAQEQKLKYPDKGYNELLEYRMTRVLPLAHSKKVKVITNMGAANPHAAARVIKSMAEDMGITNLKIAAVRGDDVFEKIDRYQDFPVLETGEKLSAFRPKVISANAYIGAAGIIEALENGADIVITGRVADPSLVVGPLAFEFGWSMQNYDMLGKGTLAGHLLECGAQVSGGYFADPGFKEVADLWNVGFPIAEIFENGDLVVTKLVCAGGLVSTATVKEQLLYEIHDPARYLTPDVIADFSQVRVKELEPNQIFVSGATGKPKTNFYKTSIGYKDCFIVEAEISYGGSGAYERASLAGEIILKRLNYLKIPVEELQINYIGVNSLYKDAISKVQNGHYNDFKDVRLRVTGRTTHKEAAIRIGYEVEALMTNGPAGGGGVRVYVKDNVSIISLLIPGNELQIKVEYLEV
jgi:hypothetical protein